MLRSLRALRSAVLALAAIGALAAATPAPGVPFHTKLLKSAPAANDTLATAPTAISLWFNEKVELKVTTVKLAGPSGAVKLGAVTRDEKVKDAPVVAAIPSTLGAGTYTASWSVAGDDGHPVKGSFAFVVKGAK
jgi:methionine-rich copper-binding protein CopC